MLECVWEIESEILVPQMNWTKIFKVAGSGKDDKYSKAFEIVVTDQNFSQTKWLGMMHLSYLQKIPRLQRHMQWLCMQMHALATSRSTSRSSMQRNTAVSEQTEI